MKRMFLLSSIVAVTLLSSCYKTAPVGPPPVDPVAGTWIMTNAERRDAYGWFSFPTGVEQGRFHLYPDGTASYTEPGTTLEGSWRIESVSGPYYDEYGAYRNGFHERMQLYLSNYHGTDQINLYFDNIVIYGGEMIGMVSANGFLERYHFGRF